MRSSIWVWNEEFPLGLAPLGYISGIGIVFQRPLTLRLDIRGFEGLTAEEVADALLRVVAVDDIRCLTRTTKSCHR